MVHHRKVRVPAGNSAEDEPRADAVAGRDVTNPISRRVADRLLAAVALSPVIGGRRLGFHLQAHFSVAEAGGIALPSPARECKRACGKAGAPAREGPALFDKSR